MLSWALVAITQYGLEHTTPLILPITGCTVSQVYIYIKIAFMCGGIVSQRAAASRDTIVYVQQFDPHKQRDKVT